jgi:hypothetical protein
MKDPGEDAKAAPRALFEEAVRRLDGNAAGQLRAVRRRALEAGAGDTRSLRPAWKPALATAALLAVGLAWWLPQREVATPVAPAAAPPVAEEPVLVEAADEAEIYAWLSEAPVAADADGKEQRL